MGGLRENVAVEHVIVTTGMAEALQQKRGSPKGIRLMAHLVIQNEGEGSTQTAERIPIILTRQAIAEILRFTQRDGLTSIHLQLQPNATQQAILRRPRARSKS